MTNSPQRRDELCLYGEFILYLFRVFDNDHKLDDS